MTILEGYFAKIDEYPEDELKLCVSRTYPHFVKRSTMIHYPSFAPSLKLLREYKAGEVTWEQYAEKFSDEMRQYPSRQNLEWLKRRDKCTRGRRFESQPARPGSSSGTLSTPPSRS